MRTDPINVRWPMRVAVVLAAVGLVPAAALAQSNSPQATAAAKAHFAEKQASAAGRAAPKAVRPAGAASAASAPAPAARPADPNWAGALAACKNDAGLNLVRREKCVYQYCKGHWGEGECPPGSDMPTKDSFKNPFRRGT